MNVPEKHKPIAHAWVDGADIEARLMLTDEWLYDPEPSWHEKADYRIALTKPSINWDHVNPEYNYLTKDLDGTAWLYSSKPILRKIEWWPEIDDEIMAQEAFVFTSYKDGNCDWKESLTCRPGHQND